MRVANRKIIRRIGMKSMGAARLRNIVAAFAIALTTILFTSLFTIAMSVGYAWEQSNFRQVGGYAHGSFKYLTREQSVELKDDPLIKEYGLRRFVGMPAKEPFQKAHVEVSWCDANEAKWMFLEPKEGRFPKEGTNEAATDTRVLSLLGVEPEIGREFTMSFEVDGKETTETFTLCGWWEFDEAIVASHVLIPESRAEQILKETDCKGTDGMTGSYSLDIMLDGASHIEADIKAILENHGYQDESSTSENYIPTGVNWGYIGTQVSKSADAGTAAAIGGMLLLIVFTGYLIIYNIFHISVSNDIRFYGLLKTVGTTGKQIRRIILIQALALSGLGIPFGLALGYGVGRILTPVVLAQMDGLPYKALSASPVIFIGAAAFSLVTVLISCRRPGKMAAGVSPVEAVRYTEPDGRGRKRRKPKSAARRVPLSHSIKSGASLSRMAMANLGRNRSRTALTLLSLALAVVLFDMTILFVSGFDMEKYVNKNIQTDFIVADAGYFQTTGNGFSKGDALPEEAVSQLKGAGEISEGGRIYGKTSWVEEFITEDAYREHYRRWFSDEEINGALENADRNEAGLILDRVQLYGMEPFILDQLSVFEGDISGVYEEGSNEIIAVYYEDDYGNPKMESNWSGLGDTVTLRYVEEYEYIDSNTGAILDPETMDEGQDFTVRAVKYADREYKVAALAVIPNSLSYRYHGADEFIMNAQTFIRDTGTEDVLLYAYNTTEGGNAVMEQFLENYTEKEMADLDYESRKTVIEEFKGFRNMFLMLGGALSFIVGMVGILNFINAVLTGILARKREFAVLQSIGMTGKQLRRMLIWEGLYYAVGAAGISLIFCMTAVHFLGNGMEEMFWFFSYHFTVWPVFGVLPFFAALGALVPLVTCRIVEKRSIVERLREAES